MNTQASHLLSLVFENYPIRVVPSESGELLWFRQDVADACEISHIKKATRLHVDPEDVRVTKVTLTYDVVSQKSDTTSRARKTQNIATLTQSGVLSLVMGSRKPAARRFTRWVTGEVLPQILKYGSYVEGSTAEDRIRLLRTRWLAERKKEITTGENALAEAISSNLITLAEARCAHNIPPGRETLRYARVVQTLARRQGFKPNKIYLAGRMTALWPRSLVDLAHRYFQPLLPCFNNQ